MGTVQMAYAELSRRAILDATSAWSAVVGEELPPALLPRGRVPSGSDVVLPAPTAAALPLIGPEVQVLVPVDSMDPETAADPHGPTSV